jgi:predicted AlkP superfamily pyrophosphatase or phosphodiesterase
MRIALLLITTLALAAETKHVVLISIDGGAAYHLDDASVDLPNIRLVADRGVRAASSETVFPSVTHPSHTTLITGVLPIKHGVLANELPTREPDGTMIPGNSLPRSQAILTKTIFDLAKAKGMKTAAFMWPELVDDPNVDFNVITRATGQRGRVLVRNPFVDELIADGIPMTAYDLFRREGGLGLVSDSITVMAACHTIKKHKPGLIAIHVTNPDHEQHAYGPGHPLAKASLHKADYHVGQILRAIAEAGIEEDTAVFIAADHGFTSVYEEFNLRAYVNRAGLEGKVRFYEGGWAPFLRLMPSFDPKTDQPKLDKLFAELRQNLHVLRILSSNEFPSIGLPRYEDSDRVRGQYLIVGDVDTYFGWGLDDSTDRRARPRPAHGHGFLPFHPKMFPMLVMGGSGLAKSKAIGHVHNMDVAPTIARLLGLTGGEFDGRVLEEALAK